MNTGVLAAHRSGSSFVEFKGKTIIVDSRLVEGVNQLMIRVNPPTGAPQRPAPESGRRYLLICTNDNKLEYEETTETSEETDLSDLPSSLKPEVLKPHQLDGFRWMQRCYLKGRHGCLLADDMGLGKTLQVLSFLAWLIERGEISLDASDPEIAPWKPARNDEGNCQTQPRSSYIPENALGEINGALLVCQLKEQSVIPKRQDLLG
jgi:hypothetical protein